MTFRWRTVSLGALGALLGIAVAIVLHFVRTVPALPPGATLHGGYVALDGISMSSAYQSTLSITYDKVHPGWLPSLPLYSGIGLMVGLLAAVTWRRLSGSWPSGSARR